MFLLIAAAPVTVMTFLIGYRLSSFSHHFMVL